MGVVADGESVAGREGLGLEMDGALWWSLVTGGPAKTSDAVMTVTELHGQTVAPKKEPHTHTTKVSIN